MNTFSRRQILKGISSATVLSQLRMMNSIAQAATTTASDYKALVCILLAGGNDGHNTVVPLTQADYNSYKIARGGLALPDSNGPLAQVQTPDGTPYGLNPGLVHVQPLWTAGKLAVLANVGMLNQPVTRAQYLNALSGVSLPTNLFSHSDQVQQWQSGIGSSSGGTGWGGRALDAVTAMNGTSLFPASVSLAGPSLFCTGATIRTSSLFPGFDLDMAGMNLWPASATTARYQGVQNVITFDSGLKLVQAANKSRKDAMDLNALLVGNTAQVNSPFPATTIGDQLKQVAKIIKLRTVTGMSRQVFFCTIGGFDTHASQSWQHWDLLNYLSDAMKAFYDATEQELQMPEKITTFTISDFGRTLQSNGGGSDHGWGSHHMIMGGAVNGGAMYGTFPTLVLGGPDDSGSRGALIPTTSHAQYGATLAKWFGVDDTPAADPAQPTALDLVFQDLKNFTARDLGFLSAS
ncbi:MAG: DUF1501 domain-containing protein [Verrucomicrobiaceae bacterium]|nr:DUF1501 domain-containing protein [Verrucomicrobiaceae bacterium]